MLLFNCVLHLLVAGAVLACDPQTQYRRADGQCCKKCGPGTRMAENTSCLDPLCKPCAADEYQPEYTVKTQCELQPFCDPNKNFVHAGAITQVKLNPCECREGFHCSSEGCISCVVHSRCAAGQRAAGQGNVKQDTVCQDCPPNTFSTEESTDSACRNWTACETGFHTKTPGTTTSDVVCEQNPRVKALWIVPVVVFILAVLGFFAYMKCACGEKRKDNNKLHCEEYGPLEVALPPDGLTLIAQPQDEEVCVPVTPEETEDPEPLQSAHGAPLVTDNGHMVVQERGKSLVFSREESRELAHHTPF